MTGLNWIPGTIYNCYSMSHKVQSNIIMNGIDDYNSPVTPNDTLNWYYNYMTNWNSPGFGYNTNVPFPASDALINGFTDLSLESVRQYFSLNTGNIAVMGHTHWAMLNGYDINLTPIDDSDTVCSYVYANTGTWINASSITNNYPTRTFVTLELSEDTGDIVDCISLYKVDPSGNPVLISKKTAALLNNASEL